MILDMFLVAIIMILAIGWGKSAIRTMRYCDKALEHFSKSKNHDTHCSYAHNVISEMRWDFWGDMKSVKYERSKK